jgi:glycosyltransferase involved in cell wall biosynthesis
MAAERPLSVVQVVVTDNFAGVERYVCQVAGELSRRGHQVHTIGGDPGRMRAELPDPVPNRPAGNLVSAARALAAVRGADIVHVHMTAAEGAAWLARPRQRAPVIATRHFARERGSSAVARALAAVTRRAISCDVAISRFVAETITSPSVTIPNGVPDRDQAALESSTIVMLQRLDAEKAPDVGIRAFSLSGLGEKGWRLVVAGQGQLGPSLRHLVEELGLAGSVDLVGAVTDTDALLEGASVLLAPAPLEPFGLSVVEAMAHGLPVVAAAGGAHLETVGRDGLLFPPGDPRTAAAALVRLGDGPAVRRAVGEALRRRQQDRFTLAGHVDRLEGLYREVADGPERPGRDRPSREGQGGATG